MQNRTLMWRWWTRRAVRLRGMLPITCMCDLLLLLLLSWGTLHACDNYRCCKLTTPTRLPNDIASVIMATLRSRCGHFLLPLWFLLVSFFFLAYSQPSQIGCLPYFHTWCGLSANLECRSEMCCTRLAENTGRKNCHLCTIAQLCLAISSQLGHISTIRKKTC